MKLTNEQLMAAAKADFAKVCTPTEYPGLNTLFENVFVRGWAAGGEFAAANIMKQACDDAANAQLDKIMEESK